MSIHIYIFETQVHQRSSLIQRFVEREVCQGCSIEKKGNGKPYLKGAPQGVDLNISHSGNLLCIALSDDGEVGVDIVQYEVVVDIVHYEVVVGVVHYEVVVAKDVILIFQYLYLFVY